MLWNRPRGNVLHAFLPILLLDYYLGIRMTVTKKLRVPHKYNQKPGAHHFWGVFWLLPPASYWFLNSHHHHHYHNLEQTHLLANECLLDQILVAEEYIVVWIICPINRVELMQFTWAKRKQKEQRALTYSVTYKRMMCVPRSVSKNGRSRSQNNLCSTC